MWQSALRVPTRCRRFQPLIPAIVPRFASGAMHWEWQVAVQDIPLSVLTEGLQPRSLIGLHNLKLSGSNAELSACYQHLLLAAPHVAVLCSNPSTYIRERDIPMLLTPPSRAARLHTIWLGLGAQACMDFT